MHRQYICGQLATLSGRIFITYMISYMFSYMISYMFSCTFSCRRRPRKIRIRFDGNKNRPAFGGRKYVNRYQAQNAPEKSIFFKPQQPIGGDAAFVADANHCAEIGQTLVAFPQRDRILRYREQLPHLALGPTAVDAERFQFLTQIFHIIIIKNILPKCLALRVFLV